MEKGGMSGLLNFLNMLKQNKMPYSLDHCRHDSVMVTFALVGKRIELDFFEDHIEYSIFSGDESVEDDVGKLRGMIEHFVAG
jgi:hypothetical protein